MVGDLLPLDSSIQLHSGEGGDANASFFLHLREVVFFASFAFFFCICLALIFLLLWQSMDEFVSHAPF